MKVLLLQDVDRLGRQGETVEVRDGYARNFLLPKSLAVKPGPGAGKELELARRRAKRLEQKLVSEAEEIRRELVKIPEVVLELRANETGALYGSVTPSMIADALRALRLKVDAKQIDIRAPIKSLGEYEVPLRLYRELVHPLKIRVVATAEVKPEEPKAESTPKKEPTA